MAKENVELCSGRFNYNSVDYVDGDQFECETSLSSIKTLIKMKHLKVVPVIIEKKKPEVKKTEVKKEESKKHEIKKDNFKAENKSF